MHGSATQKVSTTHLAVAFGSAVLAVLTGVLLYVQATGFAELSAGFGGDLPGLTNLMLHYGENAPFLATPLFVPALVLFFQRKAFPGDPKRGVRVSVVGLCLYFLLLGVFYYAMYLPIFKLGPVV